ncbi:MAG: hypothetical protein CVV42_17215 [Candidatus Riflebacteria bacterium HGW-Riflebacteria-2]|jgi:diguanylate cyclase (GGDEF)-like protein|nr:MAG: hypothetical protein CVV42_17215 [Candidatus Riflebacteria bacterium HGW-Riflebacteria-2]
MPSELSKLKGKERLNFLKEKYRELLLVHKLDRITDRYRVLDKLIYKSLKVLVSFFNCEIGAFLRGQNITPNKAEGGFVFASCVNEHPEKVKEYTRKLLNEFLREPMGGVIQNYDNPNDNKSEIKNYIIVPMILRDDIEGAFLLANRSKGFGEKDVTSLKSACSQLDNAVEFCRYVSEHKEANQSLTRQKRELEILYAMSLSLNHGYDLDTLLRKILENVMNLLKIDRASVMKYDQKTDTLQTLAVLGEKQNCRLARLNMGKGIAGLVLASGKPIFAPLGSEDRRFLPFTDSGIKVKKIYSFACIPLVAKDNVIGVINFSMLSPKKSIRPNCLDTLSVAANMISLAFQRQEFYQMSIKDELTGLYAFRHFKERLAEECMRCRRYKMPFSLILFDLDHFKSVNDTYGHPFGNVVLKEVSAILIQNIRVGVDMPARFGGEELVVVLPHTEAPGAEIVAQRIRSQVENLALKANDQAVKITISGGIACFPTHADDGETLLKKADEALYAAKEQGRNRIIIAPAS